MNPPIEYLSAKQVVDTDALNEGVFQTVATSLRQRQEASSEALHVVEIGGGIGTMVVRLCNRGVFRGDVEYRLIDRDPECISAARVWLPAQLRSDGFAVTETDTDIYVHEIDAPAAASPFRLTVELQTADAFSTPIAAWDCDCVIGAALFDIVSLDRAIPWLQSVIGPDGILYAPVTYNGKTRFEPEDPLDVAIEREYHRHMDEVRAIPGGSAAGKKLKHRLKQSNILAVEASGDANWEIDTSTGSAQRFVVGTILDTIESALAELPNAQLDTADLECWFSRRRRELRQRELHLHAHHLDIVAGRGSRSRGESWQRL